MAGMTTALIIAGIASAAGSAGSAAINARASGKATKAQTKAAAEARQIEQAAEEENRRQFDETQRQNQRNWETEQDREQQRYDLGRTDALRQEAQANARWAYDNKRRATSRAAGKAAVEDLAQMAGLTLRPTDPPPDMAQGWDANSLTPPQTTPGFTRPSTIADPRDPRFSQGTQPVNRTMGSLGGVS